MLGGFPPVDIAGAGVIHRLEMEEVAGAGRQVGQGDFLVVPEQVVRFDGPMDARQGGLRAEGDQNRLFPGSRRCQLVPIGLIALGQAGGTGPDGPGDLGEVPRAIEVEPGLVASFQLRTRIRGEEGDQPA